MLVHYKKEDCFFTNAIDTGKILLIDELDKQYIKKGPYYVTKALDESLRQWLGAGKTIYICRVWSPEEIRKNLGESTVSLLKRRCAFIELAGDDYSET